MENRKNIFPIRYPENLCNINDINFTPREIDVMACLISARGTSKISSFLSIAPKTVVNHIHNLMQKIGCNSREGIIDFIEKFGKQHILRAHYSDLIRQSAFRKSLKKIAKLIHKPMDYSLIYWSDDENLPLLLTSLKNDLVLVGIKVDLELGEAENLGTPIIEPSTNEHDRIFVMPKYLKDIEEITKRAPDNSFFLFLEKADFQETPTSFSKIKSIDCTESQNYYFVVFEILRSIISDINIEYIIEEFKQQSELENAVSKAKEHLEAANQQKQIFSLPASSRFLKKKKWFFLSGFTVIISMISLVLFNQKSVEQNISIRSELIVPHYNVFLDRPELTAELDAHLQGRGGIKAVAVVGTGGAGKTTLTRQYVHQQKENIIWEINAETQGSLKSSFKELAPKLAITESDNKEFSAIQNIRDAAIREEKILEFVRERLKRHSNWLLLYDNVENFTDIEHYFPQDSKIWGEGKIIITTRNANIQNNSQMSHVVFIGELNLEKKRDLFRRIIASGSNSHFSSVEHEEDAFLEKIPPFPLDISVAAYYIKSTNISYANYIERLNQQSEEFNGVQENLLKDAVTYLKTRYSIITLSLENIIKNHKDFADLLLFISLLDSQDIPRDLLNRCKDKTIVDSFIYHLKKHSFITNELSSTISESAFSLHRSTQAITLAYLTKKLNLAKNNELINSIGKTFGEHFNSILENWNGAKYRELISHCEIFLGHDDLLTDSLKGDLSVKLGSMYAIDSANLFPSRAKNLIEKALQILDKSNPKNYGSIAQGLFYLSFTAHDMGDDENAKLYCEKSIEVYKKYCPENQLGLARVSAFLGWVTRQLGDFEKSRNLLEPALKIFQQHYSEENANIAWSSSLLGAAYYDLGYYKKAKTILEKSLSIYEKYYPKNYGSINRICICLGKVHCKLKHYKTAKNYLKKSINIYKNKTLNAEFCIQCALAVLGVVYRDLHEYEKARNLLENGLVFHKKFYGKDHFYTGGILRELGKIYLLENNIEKAEDLLKRSLSIFQTTNHIEIYLTLESLAELYLKKSSLLAKQGNVQEARCLQIQAIDCLRQALEVVTTRLSADSPHRVPIEVKLKDLQE